MKKFQLLTCLLALFLSTHLLAQSTLTAKMGTIFTGVNEKSYSGSITILTGSIKKGQKLDVYAETGRKFVLTITKISNNDKEVKEAKAGQYAFFEFTTESNASTGRDYLREGYMVYAAGQKPTGAASTKQTKKSTFNTLIDGTAFSANVTYKGASFWTKGVKNYIARPYLQIQFSSTDAVDDRLLTIQIFEPKTAPATYYAKDMEVNFTGSKDGDKAKTKLFGFVNGKGDTDFSLSITQWKKVSDTKVIISGTVTGSLREIRLLGKGKHLNEFKDGKFENVEVEVFLTQPDLKEMMKAAGFKAG